jgi:hypothetical protein
VPTFNYVTGNPSNLTPGGPLNMTDIQGPFTDLRSGLNGNLDEVNVPNLSAAFTTYKTIHEGRINLVNAVAATYVASTGSITANNALLASGNALVWDTLIHLDPVRYNANVRTTKLALRVAGVATLTGPGTTMTFGLYPIATYNQDPAFNARVDTVGAVVAGSTAAVATPAGSTFVTATSTDFNFPAAGAYLIAAVNSGAMAASTGFGAAVYLDMRQA